MDGARGKVAAEGIRAPGLHRPTREAPVSQGRGSASHGSFRRRENTAAESLTGGGVRGEASGVRLLGFGSAAGWNEMQGGGPGANYRPGGDPGPLCCWARARSPAGRSALLAR